MAQKTSKGVVKLCDVLASISLALSKIFLIALIGIFTIEVVLRYVFNRPTGFADELSGYFLAGLVMMGVANTLRIGGHVRVELLHERLPDKIKSVLTIVMNLLAIGPLALLTWLSLELIAQYYRTGRLSFASILLVPMWIPVSLVPVGLAILILRIIAQFLEFLDDRKSQKEKRHQILQKAMTKGE